jgi:hypothetical protein
MMTKKYGWSEADDAKLRDMIRAGASPARCSVAFKRKIIAVQIQARKLGMPFKPMRELKKAREAKYLAAERSLQRPT